MSFDARHAFLGADTVAGFARFAPRSVAEQYLQQHASQHRLGANNDRPNVAGLNGANMANLLQGRSLCRCACSVCDAAEARREDSSAEDIGSLLADPDPQSGYDEEAFENADYEAPDVDEEASHSNLQQRSANFAALGGRLSIPQRVAGKGVACRCGCTCSLPLASTGAAALAKGSNATRRAPDSLHASPEWDAGASVASRIPLDVATGGAADVCMARIRVRGFSGGDAVLAAVSSFFANVVLRSVQDAGGDVLAIRGNVVEVAWIAGDEQLSGIVVRAVRCATNISERAHALFGFGNGSSSIAQMSDSDDGTSSSSLPHDDIFTPDGRAHSAEDSAEATRNRFASADIQRLLGASSDYVPSTPMQERAVSATKPARLRARLLRKTSSWTSDNSGLPPAEMDSASSTNPSTPALSPVFPRVLQNHDKHGGGVRLHVSIGVGCGRSFVSELGGGEPQRSQDSQSRQEERPTDLPAGLKYNSRWTMLVAGRAAVRCAIAEHIAGAIDPRWDHNSPSPAANSVVICQHTAHLLRRRRALTSDTMFMHGCSEFIGLERIPSHRSQSGVVYQRISVASRLSSTDERISRREHLSKSEGVPAEVSSSTGEVCSRPMNIGSGSGSSPLLSRGPNSPRDTARRNFSNDDESSLAEVIRALRPDRVGLLGIALAPFVPRVALLRFHGAFVNGELHDSLTRNLAPGEFGPSAHTSIGAARTAAVAAAAAQADRLQGMASGRSRLRALASSWSASGYESLTILECSLVGLLVSHRTLSMVHSLLRTVQEAVGEKEGEMIHSWVDDSGFRMRFAFRHEGGATGQEDALISSERVYASIQEILIRTVGRSRAAALFRVQFAIVSRKCFYGVIGTDSRCDITIHGSAVALADSLVSYEMNSQDALRTSRGIVPTATLVDDSTAEVLRARGVCELQHLLVPFSSALHAPCAVQTTENAHGHSCVHGWKVGPRLHRHVWYAAALAGMERKPIVGRDAELAYLRAAVDALASGRPHPSLIAIEGIEGSGKTRLVLEVERYCRKLSACTSLTANETGSNGSGVSFLLSDPASNSEGTFRAWWHIVATLVAPPPHVYGPECSSNEQDSWTEADLSEHLRRRFSAAPALVPYVDWLRAALPPLPLVLDPNQNQAPVYPHGQAQVAPRVLAKVNELVVFLLRQATCQVDPSGAVRYTPIVIGVEDAPLMDSASWSLLLAAAMHVPSILFVVTAKTSHLFDPIGDGGKWKPPREYSKVFLVLNQQAAGSVSSNDLSLNRAAIRLGPLPPLDSTAQIVINEFADLRASRLQSATEQVADPVTIDCEGREYVPTWPQDWDNEVAEEISKKSHGSPFVALELVRTLVQSAAGINQSSSESIARSAGKDPIGFVRSHLPDSVSRLMMNRIQELSPEHTLVLKVLSVCGQEASIELLSRVMPRVLQTDDRGVSRSDSHDLAVDLDAAVHSIPELRAWLVELARQGFVTVGDQSRGDDFDGAETIRFRHSLTRQTAYSMLLPIQREMLHARLVRAYDMQIRTIRSPLKPPSSTTTSSAVTTPGKDSNSLPVNRPRVSTGEHLQSIQAYHILQTNLSADENFIRAIVTVVRVAATAKARLALRSANHWYSKLLAMADAVSIRICEAAGAVPSELMTAHRAAIAHNAHLREPASAHMCIFKVADDCHVLPGELLSFGHESERRWAPIGADPGTPALCSVPQLDAAGLTLTISKETRARWERQFGDMLVRSGDLGPAISHLNHALLILGEPAVPLDAVKTQALILKEFFSASWKNYLLKPRPQGGTDFNSARMVAGSDWSLCFVRAGFAVNNHSKNVHTAILASPFFVDARDNITSKTLLATQLLTTDSLPSVVTELAVLYSKLGEAFMLQGDLAPSAYAQMRALKLALKLQPAPVLSRSLANMAVLALFFAKSHSWCSTYADQAERVARKLDHFSTMSFAICGPALARCAMCDWKALDTSLEDMRKVIDQGTTTWRDVLFYQFVKAHTLVWRGKLAESCDHLRRITSPFVPDLTAVTPDRRVVRQDSSGDFETDAFILIASMYLEINVLIWTGQMDHAKALLRNGLSPWISHSAPAHLVTRDTAGKLFSDTPTHLLKATMSHWGRAFDISSLSSLDSSITSVEKALTDLKSHYSKNIVNLFALLSCQLVGVAVVTLWRDALFGLHSSITKGESTTSIGEHRRRCSRLEAIADRSVELFREIASMCRVFAARERIQDAVCCWMRANALLLIESDQSTERSRDERQLRKRATKLKTRGLQLLQSGLRVAAKASQSYELAACAYLRQLIEPHFFLENSHSSPSTVFGGGSPSSPRKRRHNQDVDLPQSSASIRLPPSKEFEQLGIPLAAAPHAVAIHSLFELHLTSD